MEPTTYKPGDRVLILTQRGHLNGTEATVLAVRNRGGRPFCLNLARDTPGWNGQGETVCPLLNDTKKEAAAVFVPRPRLTLRSRASPQPSFARLWPATFPKALAAGGWVTGWGCS